MSQDTNVYVYDQTFCQIMGYKYIKFSMFQPTAEEKLAALCSNGNVEALECSCVVSDIGIKCGDEQCPNRARKIECGFSCGPKCANRTLSVGLFPDYLELTNDEKFGKTFVPKKAIKSGTSIIEYVGVVQSGVIGKNQFYAYPLSRDEFGSDMYVNCFDAGNETRLIPHSMSPNCKISPWIVGRQIRLLVEACQDIIEDEVLTLFYPQHKEGGITINFKEDFYPEGVLPDALK